MENNIYTAGLGEILWDLLPNGKVLGGAPANFAFHLNSLGVPSLPISSVGNDSLGDEILRSLKANSLTSDYIQITNEYETGVVEVEVDDSGKPSYIIKEDVAWDNISPTKELISFAESCEAVCFGSLAQRNKISKNGIQEFLRRVPENCVKVFDINLRQHYYSDSIIDESLQFSSILKLNDEELPIVANLFGYSNSEESIIEKLISTYKLNLVALTKGGEGSLLVLPDEESFLKPSETEILDTVGAGDAFTAGLVFGLLQGYELSKIHSVANNLATFVCSFNGATPKLELENKKNILNS